MNIAMLGHKRIPSREGGVEIVVEELATGMAKKGHNVCCYNRTRRGYQKIKEFNDVKIKRAFTIDVRGIAAMTSSLFASIKVAFGKYDVVHYHAEGPAAMCFIPKFFGKRIVVTVHGLDWKRDKWGGFASKYIHFGEKMAVKYADEIIVLSENVKKYFYDTYKRETVFIPNGVNKHDKAECKLINEKWNLNKNDYILFLGRIVPEKGISYLLDAYLQLNTDKKLVIAGGSSDTDEFHNKMLEKAKNSQNIIFTGFVKGEELKELYSNAYIYVLPSDLEGMPIGLLEAMSYGNCCLVSDIAECIEAVEDKAMHFKKGNVEDLREKLQILCEDKNLVNKYKAESSDYVLNRFSWGDIVDKTLELYEG